jgi:hypothetical protein
MGSLSEKPNSTNTDIKSPFIKLRKKKNNIGAAYDEFKYGF